MLGGGTRQSSGFSNFCAVTATCQPRWPQHRAAATASTQQPLSAARARPPALREIAECCSKQQAAGSKQQEDSSEQRAACHQQPRQQPSKCGRTEPLRHWVMTKRVWLPSSSSSSILRAPRQPRTSQPRSASRGGQALWSTTEPVADTRNSMGERVAHASKAGAAASGFRSRIRSVSLLPSPAPSVPVRR
eukprot:292580-Rhodomonas_salina.1